jgi:hypothetical protein
MIDEADRQRARITGAMTAMASVAIIAGLYALTYFNPLFPAALPAWYGLTMVVPHSIVALLFLRRQPSDFAPGMARGVAIATIVGTLAVGVIFGVGVILVLAWIPAEPFMTLLPVAIEVRTLLGPGGLWLLVPLLFLQVLLLYAARYKSTTGNRGSRSSGMLVGLATLLIPLGLAFHDTTLDRSEYMKKWQETGARKEAEAKPAREALARRHDIANRAFLTGVPVCLRQGCIDSLLTSLKSAGYTVAFRRESANHYWVAASDTGWTDAYLTDETGIVLSWPVTARDLPSAAPYAASGMSLVDSAGYIFAFSVRCYKNLFHFRPTERKHIDKKICGIPPDTMMRTLDIAPDKGVVYRVIYTQIGDTAFTLNARPIPYGERAVRSFLFNTSGPSYVTTADREATTSDPQVYPCELLDAFCRYALRQVER